MKAVIMAGGEGTRLRPLTSRTPKPMMPIANRPMMEHVIDLLRRHGLTDIVVTLAFMPDAIRTYFGDGSDFGVKLSYAVEETPLGTAGSVRNAAHLLDERFLVISGDVLTDIDLSEVIAFHTEREAVATIALTPVASPLEFGIVITSEDGTIERFLEKPTWGEVFSDTINTGIFVLEPEVLDLIQPGGQVDFSGDVFPVLLEQGKKLLGAVSEGYWEDVGTLEAYVKAHQDVLDGKVEVAMSGFEISEGIWLGAGSSVDPTAKIEAPVVIGDSCRIGAGASVGQYTVLGNDVRVRSGASLSRSVVHSHTYIGAEASLRGAVVGRSCDIRPSASLEEGVVLGDECFIGQHAVLGGGVKVYPGKTVEAGAVVNDSIIWESRGTREILGPEGVTGLANLDFTPELAVRVAHAWASTMPVGSTVVTSRDTSRSARMLKRAFMSGLNAGGVNVLDLEVASIPVTRASAHWPEVSGGASVRLVPGDPESVTMRLMGGEGIDLDESARRKIERLLQRQDYRRAMGAEIGEIRTPPRVTERYAQDLERVIDFERISAAAFKLVVDYSFGSTSVAMPGVFAKLGADVLAVNPYASTARAVEIDFRQQTHDIARLVTASGAELGAIIDPGGERLTLIDGRGRVLSSEQSLLVQALLSVRRAPGVVVVPLPVSSQFESILESNGGVVLRTKLADTAVMAAAAEAGVVFGGTLQDGFIRPDFQPSPDAAAALFSILESLATLDASLADVVDEIPPSNVAHEVVPTSWAAKGALMRQVMGWAEGAEVELLDGVKVMNSTGWVLTVPDPRLPATHVWAEAANLTSARTAASDQVKRIVAEIGEFGAV